jgi:hypothetical protein
MGGVELTLHTCLISIDGGQWLAASVSQPFLHGRTPKIVFHIPRNVYRPEKVDSGERNSIITKLLSRKFIWHRARLSVATGEAAL